MAKIGDCFAMETDDTAQTQNAANKDVIALVEINASCIAFVVHGVHGCSPIRSSNSRISSTW
jgi:hypothetical protein